LKKLIRQNLSLYHFCDDDIPFKKKTFQKDKGNRFYVSITQDGGLRSVNELHSKLRDLQKYNMRAYRMEYFDPLPYYGAEALYV
jgi:hypothetical protein